MDPSSSHCRPPPALKHGLTSRLPLEEASEEVRALADALLASSPREPRLLEASRLAAEAMHHLRRVRSYRRSLLEGQARHVISREPEGGLLIPQLPPECFDDQSAAAKLYIAWRISVALHPLWDGVADEARDGDVAMAGAIANLEMELRRLAEYERRAFSSWKKALRRLDFERVEAERRRGADAARPSRRKSAARDSV